MTLSIDKAVRFVGLIASLILLLLVLTILYDAFMRYTFSQGSIFLQELEWHMFDIVMLFSIAFTLQYNRHVRVDIFYHNFTQATQEWVTFLGHIFMVVPFSFLVMYVAYDYVLMSYLQQEASADPGGIPMRYIIKSSMFFGFAFLALQSLNEIVKFITLKRKST